MMKEMLILHAKYDLEVVTVIDEDNKMINSAEFDGMDADKAFDSYN